MNRKNKTVKQLQAECRKRKIGFMMTWTKIALIKRLEDEDKRDLKVKKLLNKTKKLEKEAIDEVNKANEEVQEVKRRHKDYVDLRDEQYNEHIAFRDSVDKEVIREQALNDIVEEKQTQLKKLQKEFSKLQEEYQRGKDIMNEAAEKKLEKREEIKTLEVFIKSLI